jgi:hypothetical protein
LDLAAQPVHLFTLLQRHSRAFRRKARNFFVITVMRTETPKNYNKFNVSAFLSPLQTVFILSGACRRSDASRHAQSKDRLFPSRPATQSESGSESSQLPHFDP